MRVPIARGGVGDSSAGPESPRSGDGAISRRECIDGIVTPAQLRKGSLVLEGGAPRRPFFQGAEHRGEPFGSRLRRKAAD